MFDLDILAICQDKDKYERYSPFIKQHSLSEESWKVFVDMGEWFVSHNDIDWSSFKTWFKLVKNPTLSTSQSKLYDLLFGKLTGHIVNADLEEELSKALIGRDFATKIADKALSISEGSDKDNMDDIVSLVSAYESEIGIADDSDDIYVTTDVHKLVELVSTKDGLSWGISQLNDSIGRLAKSHFIVVAMRPDTGKTSFLAFEASNFLGQLEDKCILWFNNEEGGARVVHRVLQAGTGWNSEEIELDPLGALDEFKKNCGSLDRLKLVDSAIITPQLIEQRIKREQPGLIIFDQLWKMHGFAKESANEVQRQTMLFNWGREISKQYAPVITVHQAGGPAEGNKWLTMDMLYGSTTGIQGEADAIITVGRTYEPGEEYARYFFIPKNKMRGDIPKHRNGKFIAMFNPDNGRFETDGNFEIT